MISDTCSQDVSDLLLHASQIAAEMRARPGDFSTRLMYFRTLQRLSASSFGALFAEFPEINTPLLLRGGSSDIWNLGQIFLSEWQDEHFHYGEYGFAMPTPRRILDLAAYCGYTAVYFANRFPRAKILCVEPPGANFDTLLANTAAYPNIHCEPVAVWHERTMVVTSGHLLGDWGTHFTTVAAAAPDQGIPAYTIAEILERHNWPGADFIKCTIQGGQAEVLGGPDRPWLDQVRTVTTKAVAGSWRPGEEQRLLAAFPDQEFEKSHRGDLLVIQRRRTETGRIAEPPDPLPLVPEPPERRPFRLANVGGDFHFHRFGQAGIQLVPNPRGMPAATIAFPLILDRHSQFVTQIGTGPAAFGTHFRMQIANAGSGAVVVEAQQPLPADTIFEWTIGFEPLSGPHELLLSTEKLAPEDTDNDPARRSYFIDPRLL